MALPGGSMPVPSPDPNPGSLPSLIPPSLSHPDTFACLPLRGPLLTALDHRIILALSP